MLQYDDTDYLGKKDYCIHLNLLQEFGHNTESCLSRAAWQDSLNETLWDARREAEPHLKGRPYTLTL